MTPSQGKDELGGVYGTPKELIESITDKGYIIAMDVAANSSNTVTRFLPPCFEDPKYSFIDEKQDALKTPWHVDFERRVFNWCNPPFGNISKWVERAHNETVSKKARSILLIPQGTQKYYIDWVFGKCLIIDLIGRITFDFIDKDGKPNKDPYPKDMRLLVYGDDMIGQMVWDWRV